jgi:hypothetical protein
LATDFGDTRESLSGNQGDWRAFLCCTWFQKAAQMRWRELRAQITVNRAADYQFT